LSLWQVEGLADDPPKRDVWATCQLAEGTSYYLVSVAVLGKLVRYMAYRPRTVATPLLLQVKAAQVMKELGFNDVQASMVIAGSVSVAHLVSEPERAGWKAIQGAWRGIVRWSGWFRRGLLADNRLHNWILGGSLVGGSVLWVMWALALAFPSGLETVLGWLSVLGSYLALVPTFAWLLPMVLLGAFVVWATRPRDVVNLSPA